MTMGLYMAHIWIKNGLYIYTVYFVFMDNYINPLYLKLWLSILIHFLVKHGLV